MIFTDYEFYQEQYLLGRKSVINVSDFLFYARKASKSIETYTFSNINPNEDIPDSVQMCCCEIAELLFQQENIRNQDIVSEKVADYSVTFQSQESKEKVLQKKIKDTVYNWLLDTGYLFRGVTG